MKTGNEKLTKKEKVASVPIILGMVLACCNSIFACIIGVILFCLGALILNINGKRN